MHVFNARIILWVHRWVRPGLHWPSIAQHERRLGGCHILFPGCTSAQHGTSDEKEEEEETDGGRGGGDDSGDDDDDDDVGMRKIFNING